MENTMGMDVAALLRGARDRIERGWTQRVFARNAQGIVVPSRSPQASCWCARGAMFAALPPPRTLFLDDESMCLLRRAIREAMGYEMTIPTWNDAPERTKSEVLAAFDRAIELAEREAAA